MIDLQKKFSGIIEQIAGRFQEKPDIALILGSGLGHFPEKTVILNTIPTAELKGYPESTVSGHSGLIHLAEEGGRKVLIFQGRIHLYEGYSIEQAVLPAVIAAALKADSLLITNAAGGINPHFTPGTLMLVSSFNAIAIKQKMSPLFGETGLHPRKYNQLPPSESFNELIRKASVQANVFLREGVYWYSSGPSYETPAEIEMIKRMGGDAVGMSSVHEAFASAALGLQTACLSCITNLAAGISQTKLSHEEVKETALLVEEDFTRLIKEIILIQ
jgi:purine-nucleoside phosphorylase